MRVLSLSHRLQHRLLDNHTVVNAPNFADYDAIVLDVAGTFDVVRQAAQGEGDWRTHASVPVANGDSVDGISGLAKLLQRRREEMQRALNNGAVVCVFMAPQSRFHGVTGLNGFDRYFLLPAPDGMAWDDETIRGSEGTTAAVIEHGHPFAQVYATYDKHLLYRAVLNERAPGVAKHGRVFIRAAGGDPIGVEFPVLNGRIVFMPSPKDPGSNWLAPIAAKAILDAMAELLARSDEDAPPWATSYLPPGLEERNAEVYRARAALEQAQRGMREAESAQRKLRSIGDVLWATGDHTLLPAVTECAELLGFRRSQTPSGDPVLTDGPDLTVQLVVAGAEIAIDMAPHYQLRQRLDRIIAARAIKPRGLIVVNGRRKLPPLERKRAYADSVRVAAEALGYAVVTAVDLYRAASAALAGASDETLTEIRHRLATTNGVVDIDDLVPPLPEAAGARKPAARAADDSAEEPGDDPEADASIDDAAEEGAETTSEPSE